MLLWRILSDPVWQGIGVILALVLGVVGFYSSSTNRDKRWLYSAGIIVLLFIAFGVGAEAQRQLITDSTIPVSTSGTVAPIAVEASEAKWQRSGINVAAGQAITIRVVGGEWTVSRELVDSTVHKQLAPPVNGGSQLWQYFWQETAGTGDNNSLCAKAGCPLLNQPTGALVARIGNTRYLINEKCTFAPAEGGEVTLRMNDNALQDNAGVLAVEIKIGIEDTSDNTPNCGAPLADQ